MTTREIELARALLDALHDQDGRQLADPPWHGHTNLCLERRGLSRAGLAEFDALVALCDARGWLIRVPGKYAGHKTSLSDAGMAARLELSA